MSFFQVKDNILDLNITIVQSFFFFFSSRRRHTRFDCDWSSDVCSSDLGSSHLFAPTDGGERSRMSCPASDLERREPRYDASVEATQRERDQWVVVGGEIGRASCRERV